MKFLARLAESSDQNKMTAANLAIVITPSLLWQPPSENADIMTSSGSAFVARSRALHYGKKFFAHVNWYTGIFPTSATVAPRYSEFWTFRSIDYSYHGLFVPCIDHSYYGPLVP